MTPLPFPKESEPPATLADIARRFWWPIYGEGRDSGRNPSEAAELTGRVLARLANGSPLLRHDDHEGRLRLLVSSEFQTVQQQVRTGGAAGGAPVGFSVDLDLAETRDEYGPDPSRLSRFRDRWAIVVLEQALEAVRARELPGTDPARVDCLLPYLAREIPDWRETDITESVDLSEVRNLRDAFRLEVRRVVGETVTTPVILESELLALFA